MSKMMIALGLLALGLAAMLYSDAFELQLQADTRGNLQMLVSGAFAALGFGAGQELEKRKVK